jgi:hypothetical protein
MSIARSYKSHEKLKEDPPSLEKKMEKRPNIDHLIKRILVERRKEQKKLVLTSVFISMAITGLVVFSYYN